MRAHQGPESAGIKVADRHQEGVVRPEEAAMVVEHVVERQRGDLARVPPGIASIGMIAVDQASEQQFGPEGGVVTVPLKLGGGATTSPRQLFRREGRADHHVGQEFHGERQILSSHAQRGPRGVDVEGAADVLDDLGDLLGRPGGGPFLSKPAGQLRDARFGLVDLPGIDEQVERDGPGIGTTLRQQPQSVGQDGAPRAKVGQGRGTVRDGQRQGMLIGWRGNGSRDRGGRLPPGDDQVATRPGERPAGGQPTLDEIHRRDATDVVRRHRQRRPVLVLPGPPVPPQGDLSQPGSQAAQVFLLPTPGGFEPMPGAGQFLGSRPRVRQRPDDLEGRRFESGVFDPRRRLDLDQELAGVAGPS